MREILFRGKRTDNGEWVCGGSIIRFNKEQGEDCDLVFMPQYDEKCLCTHDANDNIIAWDKTMFYKIDPSTVGQYTGLIDKNGNQIFEGDVLDLSILGPDHSLKAVSIEHGAVGFFPLHPEEEAEEDRRWRSFWKDDEQEFWGSEYFTVIGNIHDNPELLEGGGANG